MPYKRNGIWENGIVLSFDLVISDLRQYYSKSSPQNAYTVIKQFLLSNGFTHIKDSDYVNPNIDSLEANRLIFNFCQKNKWFPYCVKKVIVSPNVKSLDVTKNITNLKDPSWPAQKQAQIRKKHREDNLIR